MEPLAPEDLVDDWSDLSTSKLGAGTHLGRYELLLPVAYGGMARVWAARLLGHRGFSKLVAIKTILLHLAHSAEFERMFLDEARIAAGVHHPNVTEIYELGEEGHVLYLAMEWVNGDSLIHVERGLHGKTSAPIDPRIAARIAADACAGLHAAHELVDEDGRLLNVVHRDVSPHNILVSLDGTVKVTDFGVARAVGQSHEATDAGQIKGKVAYMAPEVIAAVAFDRRSDIFAMGCVLYEMATGTLPFRGGNDPQVMQAVIKGVYQPPSAIIRGFPIELAGIIDRALAVEPQKRFPNAEQMRLALEEWLPKSGPIVTSSQVAALVRQRLGAHLEQRREQVKAAMAAAQDGDSPGPGGIRPSSGTTPSALKRASRPSFPGQSHSGVIATASQTSSAEPGPSPRPSPPPVAPTAASVQPVPPPLPTAPASTRPGASRGRYVLAAAAGVGFALLVGVVVLAAWHSRHGGTTAAGPSPNPSPQAARMVAPAATQAPSATPTVAATGRWPVPAASASSSPATVNVKDLPPARPAWLDAPPSAGKGASPAAATKVPALPANPY